MIAFDTNILVYAHRKDSPFHEKAYSLLKETAESKTSWAIPFPCIHEFYATNWRGFTRLCQTTQVEIS